MDPMNIRQSHAKRFRIKTTFIVVVITLFTLLGIVTILNLSNPLVLVQTPPSRAATGGFRFVSMGDTKSGTTTLAALSNQAKALSPVFIIYPGDLVSTGFSQGPMDTWKAALDGNNGNGMADKTFVVRGNHDSSNAAGWQGFFDMAGMVSRVGGSNYSALNDDLTYSFDYSNAHFVGIDVTGNASLITAGQTSWLDGDLSAAEGRGLTHAFIFFHGPIYYVDSHSGSVPLGLITVLNKHPIVTATFHGHEHVYAYVNMTSVRVPQITLPFAQFVTGNAGAGAYSCAAGRSDYCANVAGLATVDVNGETVTVSIYQSGNGTPLKTFTLNKSGGPQPTSPPQPTNTPPSATIHPTATTQPVASPTNTPRPSATNRPLPTITPFPPGSVVPGDINRDSIVNALDYVILFENFSHSPIPDPRADINGDGAVNALDYTILFENFGQHTTGGTSPTSPPARTNTPSRAPTQGGPSPTMPPVTSGQGIWISTREIQTLPISGQSGCGSGTICADAWNAIVNAAKSSWGSPNLSDYAGLGHSQGVWAGAIAAKRLSYEPGREAEAKSYFDKTIQALNAVIGTEAPALPTSGGGKHDGSLALARQFPRYVMAADLLGIYPWGAGYKGSQNYVDYILHTKFTFRVGDGGRSLTGGGKCASNGCAMGLAARIASAAYLKDTVELDDAWLSFRRYTGDSTSPIIVEFSGTGDTWYHNNSAKVAINPKGGTCAGTGYPADGVLPNDQGRGGNCPTSPNTAPGYTQYPWEGLQGAYASALMLYRLGYKDSGGRNPFQINDNALLRAVQYQWYLQSKFGGSWYDASRAAWVKHLAYKFYGYKPTTYNPTSGGRNMDYTQWTIQ